MVLPQAMAWVQYWFRVLSLKFCGKSKKKCGDISQLSPAFCMYENIKRKGGEAWNIMVKTKEQPNKGQPRGQPRSALDIPRLEVGFYLQLKFCQRLKQGAQKMWADKYHTVVHVKSASSKMAKKLGNMSWFYYRPTSWKLVRDPCLFASDNKRQTAGFPVKRFREITMSTLVIVKSLFSAGLLLSLGPFMLRRLSDGIIILG